MYLQSAGSRFFLKGSLGRVFSHRERKRVEKKAREGVKYRKKNRLPAV